MSEQYCEHESMRFESKSYCEPWERWTNCREFNKCIWRECVHDDGQLVIDIDDADDGDLE